MQLDEFIQNLHTEYQGDIDYPDSDDDEYTLFTALLKRSIHLWNDEKGITWRELWVLLSDAADGDKTVAASTLAYSCPTDFRVPATYVRTYDSSGNNTFYKVISPNKAQLFVNTTAPYCHFTGNSKTGFTLTFLQQPTAGHTIEYPYYKTPFIPTSDSHVIEMSEPWFAVHTAAAKLFTDDNQGSRATLQLELAQAKLSSMRTLNELPAYLQENYVPDRDYEVGGDGFGL